MDEQERKRFPGRGVASCAPLIFFVIISFARIPLQPQFTAAQSAAPRTGSEVHTENKIPKSWYEKVRKYGPWDYKTQSYKYRDFTLFNYGATGRAAGLDEDTLIRLTETADREISVPPAEAELRDVFSSSKEVFDKVRAMSDEDVRVIRIAFDFTSPEKGLVEERWNEYRFLFKQLGLTEGIVRSGEFPDVIFLVARAQGLCTGGSGVGYAYSVKPLVPIVETLEKGLRSEITKNAGRHYAFVFKTLKEDWYVFYHRD